MARPLRIDIPDGIYHVTSRGLERRPIVRDDADREKWAELLDQVAKRRDWRVFAWALMPNHYHLFLRVPHADLSAGMHDLNAGYASVFNKRHNRRGPVFQGRFKGILVERHHHYWELSRYVHLNPVRAGLVKEPQDYRWNSCRFYLLGRGAPDWLAWEEVLGEHGKSVRVARQAYRKFLSEGLSAPSQSPLEHTVASTLLGSQTFIDGMKSWLQRRLPDREVPAARQLRRELEVADIEDAVCLAFGVEKTLLSLRGVHGNRPRAVALYLCRALTRCSMCELGTHFGGVNGQAVSNTVRQIIRQRTQDRKLDIHITKIETVLRRKM